ncbi:MAG: hypothetical protein HY370_05235 [Proteobacteria bacterium]|nr:hypothetical protein [Pseudomonadota bacterium]
MFSQELIWWISAVDLPALGGLFWLIWRTRKESEDSVRHLREIIDTRNAQLRDALAAFKLEVAKGYASISDMRELEARLVGHLLRIETKLDATAMKTEALNARKEKSE